MYNKSDYSYVGVVPVREENIDQIIRHMNGKYYVLRHEAIFREFDGYVSAYIHKDTSPSKMTEFREEIKKMENEMIENAKNQEVMQAINDKISKIDQKLDETIKRVDALEKPKEELVNYTFPCNGEQAKVIIDKMEPYFIITWEMTPGNCGIDYTCPRSKFGDINSLLTAFYSEIIKKQKEEEPVKQWHFFFDDEEIAREVYYRLHIADIEKYNMKRVNYTISYESKRSETKLVDALINHAADLADKAMAEKGKKYTHYYTCHSKAEALDIMEVIDAMKKTGFDISWNGDHKIEYHAEDNAKRENIWYFVAGIAECRQYYK